MAGNDKDRDAEIAQARAKCKAEDEAQAIEKAQYMAERRKAVEKFWVRWAAMQQAEAEVGDLWLKVQEQPIKPTSGVAFLSAKEPSDSTIELANLLKMTPATVMLAAEQVNKKKDGQKADELSQLQVKMESFLSKKRMTAFRKA